jgi:hypothetical protein
MDYRYRVLIMEDDEDGRPALEKALARAVPEARVDAVGTAQEARDLVTAARLEDRPYHAAVLDFQVPSRVGGELVIDETVCQALAWAPDTLVLHPTLFTGHPDVLAHLAMYHSRPTVPAGDVIDKAKYGWIRATAEEVARYIYSRSIRQRLGTIFGGGRAGGWGHPDAAFAESGYAGRDASLTYALMDLSEDIEAHYHQVDEPTRERIRDHFYIQEAPGLPGGPITVRLTDPEA